MAAVLAYKYFLTPKEPIIVEVLVEPEVDHSALEAVRKDQMYSEVITLDLPARNQKFPSKKELEGLTQE